MSPIVAFILGLLAGWIIEWLIDWLFPRKKVGAPAQDLSACQEKVQELERIIEQLKEENETLRRGEEPLGEMPGVPEVGAAQPAAAVRFLDETDDLNGLRALVR